MLVNTTAAGVLSDISGSVTDAGSVMVAVLEILDPVYVDGVTTEKV